MMGCAFCLLIAGLASAQDKPMQTITADGVNWIVYNQSDVLVKPGSALDFSFLVEQGPAGKHGMTIINGNGELAFTQTHDKAMRLYGCAFPMFDFKCTTDQQIIEMANQIHMAGYNAVRPHWLDIYLMDQAPADFVFNPDRIKCYDRFTWELKKRGIYLIMDAISNSTMYSAITKPFGGKLRNEMSKLRMYYDPAIQEHWKKGVKILLDHVNPHSGLALKDDPQMIFVAARNEPGLNFNIHVGGHKGAQTFIDNGIRPLFVQWLRDRYKTMTALKKAWGKYAEEYDDFNQIDIPSRHTGNPDADDVHRFFTVLEQQTYAWMSDWLRQCGVKVPIVDYNNGGSIQCALTRTVMPMVDMHGYHDHPMGWGIKAKMVADSLIGSSALTPCRLAATRLWGAPYTVTEWGMPYFNPWRYESGMVAGSYASMQDWQMIMQHSLPVELKITDKPHAFRVGRDPSLKPGERMTALLYGGRNVATGRGVIAVQLNEKVADDLGWTRGLPSDMLKLALISRIGSQLPQGTAARATIKADLMLTPGSGSLVLAGENAGAETVIESISQPQLTQQAVNALRQSGILSQDNLTDVANDVYQSDTGQLTLKSQQNFMSVNTPHCQGATLAQSGHSAKLSDIAINNHGKGVSLLLSSLDGKAINQSSRMLLITATNSLGSGSQFTEDFTQSANWGSLPFLMQPAKVTVMFNGRAGVKPRVWALNANGSHSQELTMKPAGHGNWLLLIDGQTLGKDITPYFEVQMFSE